MPKPHILNEYVQTAVQVWNTPNFTFCLMYSRSLLLRSDEYRVRVFPHDDTESFWLKMPCGPAGTESGAAYLVLNYLNEV